jgi:hypothetical protein
MGTEITDIDAAINRLIRRAQPAIDGEPWTPQLSSVANHIAQLIGVERADITVAHTLRYVRGVPDRELRRIRGLGMKGIAKLRERAPYEPPSQISQ